MDFGLVKWNKAKTQTIKYVEWLSCREEVQNMTNRKTDGFLFRHCGDDKYVIRFMRRVERKLKLKAKLKFVKTDDKTVFYVVLTRFWKGKSTADGNMRRSLLTALLRAGRYYRTKNFQQALNSNEYLSTTQPAVQRFLNGHTKCRQRCFVGWQDEFDGVDGKRLKKILI
jgi:hypothetical protein